MKREEKVDVVNSENSDGQIPNKVELSDGSYVLWDFHDGFYRVAYYSRSTQKGSDLEMTIALAMKKPVYNSKVKKIFEFISGTDEYATVGP